MPADTDSDTENQLPAEWGNGITVLISSGRTEPATLQIESREAWLLFGGGQKLQTPTQMTPISPSPPVGGEARLGQRASSLSLRRVVKIIHVDVTPRLPSDAPSALRGSPAGRTRDGGCARPRGSAAGWRGSPKTAIPTTRLMQRELAVMCHQALSPRDPERPLSRGQPVAMVIREFTDHTSSGLIDQCSSLIAWSAGTLGGRAGY